MCGLFFRQHPKITSVIPVEDTHARAILPRGPPMMSIKARWNGAEDRHSKRKACWHPRGTSDGGSQRSSDQEIWPDHYPLGVGG